MPQPQLKLASRGESPQPAAAVAMSRRMGAEVLGTFGLTLAAASVEILAKLFPGDYSLAARAFGPALIIVPLIYGLGQISGAHFNPAVTLAFGVRGDLPWKIVPLYLLAEVVGALFAGAVLLSYFGISLEGGVNQPLVGLGHAFAAEVMLTFLLVFVVLSTATQHRILGPNAALPVGMTIAGCTLLGMNISGPSLNPARSLGPAVLSGELGSLWIYLLGPLVGSLIAAGVFSFIKGRNRSEEEAAWGKGH